MTKGELFMLIRIIEDWLGDGFSSSREEIKVAEELRDRFYAEFVKEAVQ
jgi:hypothetical protein